MFKSNTSLKSSPVPLPLPLPLGVPWHPSLIPTRTRTRSPPPGTIPGPQPLAPQAAAAGGTDRGCPYRGYPHRDRPQARQLATGSRPSLAGWAAVAVTAQVAVTQRDPRAHWRAKIAPAWAPDISPGGYTGFGRLCYILAGDRPQYARGRPVYHNHGRTRAHTANCHQIRGGSPGARRWPCMIKHRTLKFPP